MLESICEFLGLNPNADLVQQEVKNLEGNRRYAFTRDRDLASINNTLRDKDIIKRLGYASIGLGLAIVDPFYPTDKLAGTQYMKYGKKQMPLL